MLSSKCQNPKCRQDNWQVQLQVTGVGPINFCASCAAYHCWRGEKLEKKDERDRMIREELYRSGR